MLNDPATRTAITFSEILDLLDEVTPEGRGFIALCPAHADSSPSLRVDLSGKRVLLTCRARCSFPEVRRALGLEDVDLNNVKPGDIDIASTVAPVAQKPAGGDVAALAAYAVKAAANATDEARGYAQRRFGITPERFDDLGLGYDDGTLDSGRVALSRAAYRDAPRLTVPFRSFSGAVHYLQGRALRNDAVKARWSGPSNPEGAAWGKYGVLLSGTDRPEVLLTEGPGDGLTAVAAGFDAVAIRGAKLGANAALADELAAGLADRVVVVAGDADEAGETFTAEVAAALGSRGVDVRRLVIPVGFGKDLTDWREAVGEDFPRLLAEAVAAAPVAERIASAEELRFELPPDLKAVFDRITEEHRADQARRRSYDPCSTEDAHLGARIAEEYLRGSWCSSAGLGWLRWDGRRWAGASNISAQEAVRRALVATHDRDTAKADARLAEKRAEAERVRDEALSALDGDTSSQQVTEAYSEAVKAAEKDRDARLKAIRGYFLISKIKAVLSITQGVLEEDAEAFDTEKYLLNVGNGVVDLRTGKLGPHRPEYRFTKVTTVDYRPNAVHDDWTTALEAMAPGVRDWMHLRFGQAATGFPPSDDVVPFLYGGGENGKTTVVDGITAALGEFAGVVPEKVLLFNPGDHTTELTELHGRRLTILEELPQGRWLDAKRLKSISGTGRMVARKIAKDNFSWAPTHSLVITTNYELRVDENDHGTWRRLARVPFPYRFGVDRPADPTLRLRLREGRDGQHEAALAWLVAGAMRWFDAGEILPKPPQAVVESTREWRGTTDVLGRFLEEITELEEGSAVKAQDFYEAFRDWCDAYGHRPWGDQLLWERFRAREWMTSGAVTKPAKSRLGGRRLYGRTGTPTSTPSSPSRYVFGLRFTPAGG